ncbi:MAG: hypothetical protein HZB85_00910 [Deltaproteobacteria bacterium]|nr:hypothetical protein [Deltaproteobacteria bacterium]
MSLYMDNDELNELDEFQKVGVFPPSLRASLVTELNRAGIVYRLEDLNEHVTALYVLNFSSNEAGVILYELKNKNKRIRM